MAIGDDFSISGKDIRWTGAAHGANGAGYYTTIEFHRWLADLADDASVLDSSDQLSIDSDTPSDRQGTDRNIKLLNGYNITQTEAEHIYDGSITQGSGGTEQIWDGFAVIAPAGSEIFLVQNGALLDDSLGSGAFWNSIPFGTGLKGLNPDASKGISHRFMVLVRDAGADIDGRRVLGLARETGRTYAEFLVNGSERGQNVMALSTVTDLNDQDDASGYTTITNQSEGYVLLDVDNNGADEPYFAQWDRASLTINQLYQRAKYLSRGETANAGTLYGLDARMFRGITHELAIGSGSGTWVEPESLSWTGGTGQLLAVDNTAGASSTKLWIQLLTGTTPSGTITGNGGASATVSSAQERVISTPFIGVSTGSALLSGFGVGVTPAQLTNNDQIRDLNDDVNTPPNNVTLSLSGLVSGEDQILIGPDTGATALDRGQFLLNAGISAGATSITVKAGSETPGTGTDSADDTPTPGTLRVQDTNGVFVRVNYTGYTVAASTMEFTGCTGAPDALVDAECYVSYLDTQYDGTSSTDRFTAVYSSNRNLFVRVRDGGGTPIKTFEVATVFGSSSSEVSVIRNSDE